MGHFPRAVTSSEESTQFGTEDTAPVTAPDPDAADPGSRIGRYIILDKLGQGGMGVVYAAYDPELDRKVAVKVLHADDGGTTPRVAKARGNVMAALFGDEDLAAAPTAHALNPDQQRLLREAQGAARINHPNVVTVYDVGHQTGRVFVAMEFVAGKTLRAWLAEGPHPWRDVCEVMVQAGAGLAAAHDRGLIHRDFKPDNVMIDEQGRVRVMDFGLVRHDPESQSGEAEPMTASGAMRPTTNALALDLTRKGSVAGTPAYMSPEQFGGREVDARSDQFSFCVTLWEGLFGKRPFKGDSLASLAAAVLGGEREAVPTERSVPAAIREAAERGLAPEVEARWASMHDLLAVLRRDPTKARNRAFVAGGGLLALVVGVGGWQAHRSSQLSACSREAQAAGMIWNEDVAIRLREQMLATGMPYAEGTADIIVPRLDDYVASWAELAELTCRSEILGGETVELAQTAECLEERRSDLEGSVATLDEVDKTTIVGATLLVASLDPVDQCADEAALARRSLQGDLETRLAEAPRRNEIRRAERLEILRKYDEARTVLEAVLSETADNASSTIPGSAMYRIGLLDIAEGKFEDAEQHLVDATFLATSTGDESTVANATAELAWVVGYRQGRHDDAEVWMRWSETLMERLGMRDELAGAGLDDRLGMVASASGDYEDARRRLDHALTVKQNLLGPDHPELAITLNMLGNVQIKSSTIDEAAASWTEALSILEGAYGSSHPDLATPLSNLAQVRFREGDFEASKELLQRSLDLRALEVGEDHPEIGRALGNLALVMREAGDPAAARDVLVRSTEILEKAHGREHPAIAVNLANQGKIELELDNPEEATKQFREALAIQEKVLPDNHVDLAVTISAIGSAMVAADELEEGLAHYERALAICEANDDPVHTPVARFQVGKTKWQLGQRDAAISLVESAIEGLEVSKQAKEAAKGRSLLGQILAEDPATRARGLKLQERARAELLELGDAEAAAAIDARLAEQARP